LSPSLANVAIRKLDASVEASGPHDFTVRKSALSSEARLASTASRPASVTIAIRPSMWDGMARDMDVIWVKREAENFLEGDWTGGIRLIGFNKFAAVRKSARRAKEAPPQWATTNVHLVVGDGMTASAATWRFDKIPAPATCRIRT
jgi:hypothetical protein